MEFDFVIKHPRRGLVAVVEIKTGSQEWSAARAAEYRRNLILSGIVTPAPPYFLVLTPKSGYLWEGATSSTPEHLPGLTFPMAGVLQRYSSSEAAASIPSSDFHSAVFRWLSNLTDGQEPSEAVSADHPEAQLVHHGFLEAVQGAMVLTEASV